MIFIIQINNLKKELDATKALNAELKQMPKNNTSEEEERKEIQ